MSTGSSAFLQLFLVFQPFLGREPASGGLPVWRSSLDSHHHPTVWNDGFVGGTLSLEHVGGYGVQLPARALGWFKVPLLKFKSSSYFNKFIYLQSVSLESSLSLISNKQYQLLGSAGGRLQLAGHLIYRFSSPFTAHTRRALCSSKCLFCNRIVFVCNMVSCSRMW